MILALTALLSLASPGALEIVTPVPCPSSEALRAELAGVAVEGRITIAESAGGALIVALDPLVASTPPLWRSIERGAAMDCPARARLIAVLIRSWLADLSVSAAPRAAPRVPRVIHPAAADSSGDAASVSLTAPAAELPSPSTHRVHALYSTTIGSAGTVAQGAQGGYTLQLSRLMGVEILAAAFSSQRTSLVDGIATLNGIDRVSLPDRGRLRWLGAAGVSFSLARSATPWAGTVDLYGTVGLGALGVAHEDAEVTPSSVAGGGLRASFVPGLVALVLEMRDVMYLDPDAAFGGLTHHLQLGVGLTFDLDRPSDGQLTEAPLDDPPPLEIRALFLANLNNVHTASRGIRVAVAYDLIGPLSLELGASLRQAEPSTIDDQVLRAFQINISPAARTELVSEIGIAARVHLVDARAQSGVFDHLRWYVLGGLALGGLRTPCEPGQALDPETFGEGAVCPLFPPGADPFSSVHGPLTSALIGQIGMGLRLGIGKWAALVLELRDEIYSVHVIRPASIDPTTADTRDARHDLSANVGVGMTLL